MYGPLHELALHGCTASALHDTRDALSRGSPYLVLNPPTQTEEQDSKDAAAALTKFDREALVASSHAQGVSRGRTMAVIPLRAFVTLQIRVASVGVGSHRADGEFYHGHTSSRTTRPAPRPPRYWLMQIHAAS